MQKILIVDDNEDIVDMITYILKKRNYDVLVHPTGINVTEAVSSSNPNLILLDINLPGNTGTEICRQLKRVHNIPIILISGYPVEAKILGDCMADGYVEKPFHLNELVNILSSHLHKPSDNLIC